MTEESNAALADETVSETEVEAVETVETEVEETTEANEDSAPQETEDTSGKEPDGVQKRINKITAEKYEQKRRADELEKRLKEIEAQNQANRIEKPTMPTEAEFDYDTDKYNAAKAEYDRKMVQFEVQETLKQEREQAQKQAIEQQRQAAYATFESKVAASGIDNFYEATSQIPQLQPEVLDTIMNLENGVNVAYYLSQHLDQADVIASSNPVSAAVAIGEISARLKAATKQTKPSAAPEPVTPINQGGAAIGESESELIAGATFE